MTTAPPAGVHVSYLIVAVHHLEAAAAFVSLHIAQRTLQTENNIFILLHHLQN